ncbi:3-dehydroquinate synthase [Ruminococcaceae bacterium YAD3003]|nr:3-dehydroquinate synthase [Ruminococcaceae bacterium YAD3003]
MDRLDCNRSCDCFTGSGIAEEFVAGYILEQYENKDLSKEGIKAAIISDRQVSGYYYNAFEKQFAIRNIKTCLITVDEGEQNKNLTQVNKVIKELTEFGLNRNDWIIAFGGGAVIDIAGFAASLSTSGARYIAVPTTLSSMAETSCAYKAFLNSGSRKNTTSVAVEQTAIFIDPVYLSTVPKKYIPNGYAQIIRYALLADFGLLTELINISGSSLSDIRVFLNRVYKARAAIDRKNPVLLSMGCELSDAIEGYFRFMNYSEGEALALSLFATVPEKARPALAAIYMKLELPTSLKDVSFNSIMNSLKDMYANGSAANRQIVCYEEVDGKGTWAIKEPSNSEALAILEDRLKIIAGNSLPIASKEDEA